MLSQFGKALFERMITINSNNTLDKKDLLERLDRHLDWIKSCDTKASIVLAGTGIFLTTFTASHSLKTLNEILTKVFQNFSFSNLLYLLFFIFGWLAFIKGAYCLIKVLVPRLKKDVIYDAEMNNDSLYFFENISKNKFSDFRQKMTDVSSEDDHLDILSQIYINARICTIKYQYFNKGIKFAFLGIAAILSVYVVGIILLKTGGF